jgi:ABC-type dipeptide/oligopeptide/nickel transport system permease component
VISVAAFWALSLGAEHAHRIVDPAARARTAELPRFFNPEPRGIRELATGVTDSIARGDSDAKQSAALLRRLGGAALPHVLPRLDALDPAARGRVALALAPIAERMGVGGPEDRLDPEAAVLFWTRFWQDRAIDFRPAVVKRAVRRLAERSSVGRLDDIRQLDTFALPELIAEMGSVESAADVVRARSLTHAAAHVTDTSWTIGENADVQQARDMVSHWQRWWVENGADYVTLEGARRLLAMITETQYGRWATDAADNRFGISASGEPVLDVLESRAPVTLWLLAAGLLGGYAAGVALGIVSGAFAHRPLDAILSVVAVVFAALPIATLAALVAPAPPGRARFLAALLMTLTAAALVSRYQRSATRVALDQEYARTLRAFGASQLGIARGTLRTSAGATISLLGVDLPALLTAAFVLEHAFELPGLGPTTLAAIGNRDVPWLMAIALASAAAMALSQIASDALLAAIDPRVRGALARQRGAQE